ncbi:hypothetical protein [Streptomyces sp. NPDC050528]|uniref:hypothetical protein n=1 Tax=unclassified Streptomyces TaxID=2593676 RepID=UPI0037A91DF6
MPALAIGTAHSGTSTARALASHADNARGTVAPTGHFVAAEDPGRFAEVTDGFLA